MGIYSRYILEADKNEDNFDINIEEDNTAEDNNKENNEEKTEELDLKDDEDMTVDADATEKQAEENNKDNETTDENNGEENTNDNTENEETPAEDNEDFTINTDDSGEDIENTDSDTSNNIEDSEDSGEDTKSKFDAALYDSLSDSEKANKNAELLSNYKDLYISCDNIIEKINNINKDTESIKVLQRIACTLSDLKYYISFYLDNNYKNKSYYENDIMFNKYLSILNGVKNVLQEFSNKKEEK